MRRAAPAKNRLGGAGRVARRCRNGPSVYSFVTVPVPWKAVPDSSAFPSPLVVS